MNIISGLVLNLLRDERVEVREAARVALTSFCKAALLQLQELTVRNF